MKNRIITYSLLAHINNNARGIKDLNEIFVPIVKRCLAEMNSCGITKGILNEIKEQVDTTFGFNMPFPILLKILKKIEIEINDGNESDFKVFKDGSFISNKFIFCDYEEVIQQQEIELNTLQKIYEEYLISKNKEVCKEPSIYEFLDQNRQSLASFFAHQKEPPLGSKYLEQVNFILSVKDIPDVFNILRKVYLGSIITSYLEIDYGEIKDSSMEILLDSNFIIHLLDLSSPESTHTCTCIIDICRRLGYKISVLDFTIEETRALLERKAIEYDRSFIRRQIDLNDIHNACARKNLSKTDLQQISSNLVIKLKEFRINIIPDSTAFRNRARFSSEFNILKDRKSNPDGALHDATAILYVQSQRKKRVRSFYEANCWFVTDAKQDFDLLINKENYIAEMIKPEDLVNILWLTNPHVKGNEITDVGLTRLVSSTIRNSLPNVRVLKEFDENIKKYAQGKIEPVDCIRLGQRIADKTLTNLEYFNKTAHESPERFIELLNDEAEKSKAEESEKEEKHKELLKRLQNDFSKMIKEQEITLKESFSKDTKNLEGALSKSFEDKIRTLSLVNKENLLKELEIQYDKLLLIRQSLDKQAARKGVYQVITSLVFYYSAIIILLVSFSIVISIVSIILPLIILPFAYVYEIIMQKKFNPLKIWCSIIVKKQLKLYKKNSFDLNNFLELEKKILELKNELKKN